MKTPLGWAEFLCGINVPYNRPIKAYYIRNAISYYDALMDCEEA